MNVYEALEVQKDSEYAQHLKKSQEFAGDLFDREKILAFGEEYGILPEDVKEQVLIALNEIKADEGYIALCKAILYFMENNLPVTLLAPPFEEGIKAEFAMFFPVWYMAERFVRDAERRGVPKEILTKSFSGICGCIRKNKEFKGCMGSSAFFFWLPYHAKGKLFTINDFQYETAEHNGKNAVGVHIPSGTKLDVVSNLRSFKEALDFFDRFYPELNMSGMVCESWLLSPQVEEVMGKKTNISRFGDMFDRFDIGDTKGMAVFRFVYGFSEPYPSVDELPENTTLQRKMKEYMKAGKRVCAYGGFISREDVERKLKEAEG